MQSLLLPRTAALTACLCIGAAPLIVAAPAHAADTPGPATCYVADENENILEPRREYVPNDGTGEVPVRPSPVVPGQYTLEISAPALNFDPDQPDVHFVCEVFYSPLGSVRLVDANGTVLATQRYNNDQHNPSRAALTALPALPEGYEFARHRIVATRQVRALAAGDFQAGGANIVLPRLAFRKNNALARRFPTVGALVAAVEHVGTSEPGFVDKVVLRIANPGRGEDFGHLFGAVELLFARLEHPRLNHAPVFARDALGRDRIVPLIADTQVGIVVGGPKDGTMRRVVEQ